MRDRTWVKRILSRGCLHLVVGSAVALWLIPSIGLLLTSFRPYEQLVRSGWWTVLWRPAEWTQLTLENYVQVLLHEGLAQSFLNSLKITLPASAFPILIAAMAAYAFAFLPIRGKRDLMIGLVVLIVVPIQVTFVPLLKLYNGVDLSGTFLGVWLAHTGYGLPLMIYLLHNFFRTLPTELIEAAAIDGASHWRVFWRIVLPLSTPALTSVFVLHFLWVWNDLLVALIFLGPSSDVAPLTIQIVGLVGQQGQNWHLLTAGAFVSMIVPLLVFFAMQRSFISGLLAWSDVSANDR